MLIILTDASVNYDIIYSLELLPSIIKVWSHYLTLLNLINIIVYNEFWKGRTYNFLYCLALGMTLLVLAI